MISGYSGDDALYAAHTHLYWPVCDNLYKRHNTSILWIESEGVARDGTAVYKTGKGRVFQAQKVVSVTVGKQKYPRVYIKLVHGEAWKLSDQATEGVS